MIRKKSGSDTKAQALEIEVVLEETSPRIWRRLVLSPRTDLAELHEILQVAMGWQDCHLHEFTQGDDTYGDPYQLEDVIPEARATVGQLLRRKGDALGYVYDFGDGWTHTVRLVAVRPAADAGKLPICVAGERACPPEDCGGVYGYYDLLEILADPKHEEHEERKEWLDGDFDPDAFDAAAVTRRLRRLGV